jgi:hypothetical protein
MDVTTRRGTIMEKTFFEIYNALHNKFDFSYQDKEEFHRDGKKFLKMVAKLLNCQEYDVHSCKGGDAVVGEVSLHTPTLYVSIGNMFAYARKCDGMKDYVGSGMNNSIPKEALKSAMDFIEFLQTRSLVN